MSIIKDIKSIFKMALADAKNDFIPVLKPVIVGVIIVGISYAAAYLIDMVKLENKMIFMNLGALNNFALFMFIVVILLLINLAKRNEKIKKLEKEMYEV